MQRRVLQRLRPWLLLTGLLLLGGCAVAEDCESVPLTACDKAFNAALADELDTAPASAKWPQAVTV